MNKHVLVALRLIDGQTGNYPVVPAKSRFRQVRFVISENPVSRQLHEPLVREADYTFM